MAAPWQDLRFAVRNLRRSPGVPLAAVVTLALGIGATTAIFSTVNAALLRPLPYPDAGDLYSIRTTLTDGRVTTGLVAASEIVPLNRGAGSIVRAAGLQQFNATLLRDDGTPAAAFVYAVTEGFFELFGLPMTLGGLRPEHYAADGPPQHVIISARVWREHFQSDPQVVGKPLRFRELSPTVAGVAPEGFDTPHQADYWVGVRAGAQDLNHSLEGFMRLRPGTPRARAETEMAAVMAEVARQFPASAKARAYVVRPLVESIVGDLRPILIVVLAATGLLLGLACVNVTNLLLARGAARAREMAVRVALGASRGRIVRQLLTESVLLAAVGSIVGLLVASMGVRLLMSLGAATLPRLDAVPFDATVLLFALAVLFISGIFVGFAPALRLARTDVKTLMNESGRSGSAGRGTGRWLTAMTVAEIALAITLVAGAGWLIRSFSNLRTTDPGFAAEQRMIFDVTLQGARFQNRLAVLAGLDDVLTRLRAQPGVAAAGATSNFPLRNAPESSLLLHFEGEAFDAAKPKGARQRLISPGFLEAAGVDLVAGRDVLSSDRPDGARVVLVNRTFVERYVPAGRDPIGVRFSYGYPTIFPDTDSVIVGVVEDVRQNRIVEPAQPAFYTPLGQDFGFPRLTMVVQTKTTDVTALQSAIRADLRAFEPAMAVEFLPVTDLVASTLRRQELGMTLMLIFGAVAVTLAAVGIYGVIAYATTQRRNEVATRVALGATAPQVFWLVLRQGLVLAAAGTAIGLTLAFVAGRIVSSHVYAVRAVEPDILAAAIAIVAAITILATMVPAVRASRLDPARILRAD